MLISFDIFDTAIKRKTYLPSGVFEIIEDIVKNNFKEKRTDAENKTRLKNKFYNLDDIYEFLPGFNKNIEIDIELKNCIQNEEVYKIYKWHVDNKDEVIFISDMYLSSDILTKILENCGYKNPKIFVSCENKAYKGDGTLFNAVKSILNKNIDMHYGDNYNCDIISAKKCGIKSNYIPRLDTFKTNIPDISTKLKKYLVENENSDKVLNQKVACYWSPIIYNFTKWVLEERDKNNPNSKVFFNARDGYIPFIIARDLFMAKNIFYIHTSRKSLLPSSFNLNKDLGHSDNSVILDRIVLQRTNGISGLLKLLNFPEEKKYLLLKSDIEDYPKKEFILLNKNELVKHFKQQKENTIKYLNKNNIQDGDILVDIGYYGSLQYAIQNILGVKLKGYYLQCFENSDLNEDEYKRYSYFNKNIIKYCLMVESLFSSDEDGVMSYDEIGNPIFYEDNSYKKNLSKEIEKEVLKSCKYIINEPNFKITYADIEKLATRFQYFPTSEESHYCTEEIFENGDIDNYESVVWYNRERIKQGELQDFYNKSYWRPAFEKLLQNDKELSHLEKYLKKEY